MWPILGKTMNNHCFSYGLLIFLGVGDVVRILKQYSIRIKKQTENAREIHGFGTFFKGVEVSVGRLEAIFSNLGDKNASRSRLDRPKWLWNWKTEA